MTCSMSMNATSMVPEPIFRNLNLALEAGGQERGGGGGGVDTRTTLSRVVTMHARPVGGTSQSARLTHGGVTDRRGSHVC